MFLLSFFRRVLADSLIIQRRFIYSILSVEMLRGGRPEWTGMSVRIQSDLVSGMNRIRCPVSIGLGVRNGPEYAAY